MADLPTNYLDDILAQSMNGKRKYRITRADGTFEEVILEDVSEYEQVGSNFGAGDINKTNQAVNEKFDSGDVVDPMLTTEPGFAADAKLTGDALSELNKKIIITSFDFVFSSKQIPSSGYEQVEIPSGTIPIGYTGYFLSFYAPHLGNLRGAQITPAYLDTSAMFYTYLCIENETYTKTEEVTITANILCVKNS